MATRGMARISIAMAMGSAVNKSTAVAVIAATLLLAACSDIPRARTQAEIQDIAADVADDVSSAQISELSSKVDELGSKVEDLETDKRELQAEVETLKTGNEWSEQSINRLYENDKMFAQRLGIPVER